MKTAKPFFAAAAALSCLLASRTAHVAETAVTVDEVLAMMDRVPATERGTTPYRWSRVGEARPIARAITHKALTRKEAGELTVWELFEGGNVTNAVGDGGRSHGPWQISEKRARPEDARDPEKAATIWLSIAAESRRDCARAGVSEDEQLAQLASGNCDHGRRLAARRARIVGAVLEGVP